MHSLISMFPSSSFHTGSSSSAAIIDRHYDLLKQILVLLPAKSLLRFKSVSKHWQFIISSESFVRLHLRRYAQTQHSFILGVNGRAQFFICHPAFKKLLQLNLPCSNQDNIEYVKILQSCNGLLLLKIKHFGSDYMFFHVFNPTTMQQRCINPVEIQQDSPIQVCLVFDPSESEYYKVVAFWGNALPTWFSVYHSATHQWSPMARVPPVGKAIGFSISDDVLCSLVAYFVRNDQPRYYRFFYEEYTWIFPVYDHLDTYFIESNGHLHCLLLYFNQHSHFCLQIAEMVGHEWLIDEDEFLIGNKRIHDFGGTMDNVQGIGMIRGDKIEDSTYLFHAPGQIMIYRFSDGGCEVLVDCRSDCFYEEGKLQFRYEDAHTFVQPLFDLILFKFFRT